MTKVCDTCLDAAYDEGAGSNRKDQVDACLSLGADISDHCCEQTEYGTPCACACNRQIQPAVMLAGDGLVYTD